MCLAVPMKLVEKHRDEGVAELNGVKREISLMLCPEAEAGQYVLIHAGYAIGTIDEVEARETLRLLEELVNAEMQS